MGLTSSMEQRTRHLQSLLPWVPRGRWAAALVACSALLLLAAAIQSRMPACHQRRLMGDGLEHSRNHMHPHTRPGGPQPGTMSAFQLHVLVPAKTGGDSDSWRPQILTDCIESMPEEYAPCLRRRYPNLLYAEEVMYPDFKIRLPRFAAPVHEQLFMKFVSRFHRLSATHSFYVNQHGRNFVFADTVYAQNPPPSTWVPRVCMSWPIANAPPAGHDMFGVELPPEGQEAVDYVMFMASSDNSYFQHFMDRASIMFTQASHLLPNHTRYIADAPRDAVNELWSLLDPHAHAKGFIHPGARTYAKHLVFSCHTPGLHPYTWLLSRERMMAAAGVDPAGAPFSKRRTVLLLARSGDGRTLNGGRAWKNQEQCVKGVEALLRRRGRGEVLQLWDLNRFKGMREVMQYWSQEVVAAFGVHGGAGVNHRWAARGTVFVEIWPMLPDGSAARIEHMGVWEETSMQSLQYWVLAANNTGPPAWDFDIHCQDVVAALEQGLATAEKEAASGIVLDPVVQQVYQGVEWLPSRATGGPAYMG